MLEDSKKGIFGLSVASILLAAIFLVISSHSKRNDNQLLQTHLNQGASSFFGSALAELDKDGQESVSQVDSQAEEDDVDPEEQIEEAKKSVEEAKERVLEDAKRLKDIAHAIKDEEAHVADIKLKQSSRVATQLKQVSHHENNFALPPGLRQSKAGVVVSRALMQRRRSASRRSARPEISVSSVDFSRAKSDGPVDVNVKVNVDSSLARNLARAGRLSPAREARLIQDELGRLVDVNLKVDLRSPVHATRRRHTAATAAPQHQAARRGPREEALRLRRPAADGDVEPRGREPAGAAWSRALGRPRFDSDGNPL